MNTQTVGRNEPCPCGSGKKFKRCCLGKEASQVTTSGATTEVQILGKALEEQQFTSLEEMEAFATQHIQQRNQQSLDDFHGLSPEQMYRVLHFPFDSPELVTMPEVLDTNPTAPILTLFSMLTEAMGEKGLKPTAKGNLPRNLCREAALTFWGEQTYQKRTRFGGINREEDFHDLHVTRLVAEQAGLIRKYKGRFILSRDCRRLLAENGLAAVYPKLFRTYTENFNWAYRDGYPDLRFMQNAFLFTLYLLTRYGGTWQPQAFYEDAFLRAFPSVLDEVPPNEIFSQEDIIRRCYTLRTLTDFVGFFGLADVEPTSDDILNRDYRVKALPLLGEAVKFQFMG